MVENINGSVMSAEGRTVKFGADTGILCPQCGNQSKQTLKVLSCIDHMEQIECPNCGYTDHRAEAPSRIPIISKEVAAAPTDTQRTLHAHQKRNRK
jgi:predicted RNA-binding Zn-ribbon protein involved in translation (DUF1610 family)